MNHIAFTAPPCQQKGNANPHGSGSPQLGITSCKVNSFWCDSGSANPAPDAGVQAGNRDLGVRCPNSGAPGGARRGAGPVRGLFMGLFEILVAVLVLVLKILVATVMAVVVASVVLVVTAIAIVARRDGR